VTTGRLGRTVDLIGGPYDGEYVWLARRTPVGTEFVQQWGDKPGARYREAPEGSAQFVGDSAIVTTPSCTSEYEGPIDNQDPDSRQTRFWCHRKLGHDGDHFGPALVMQWSDDEAKT
jgi:hypothetical protein